MIDKMEAGMKKNELFIVNYAHWTDPENWVCKTATHSQRVANDVAQELRVQGFMARVRSVLVTNFGKIEA